MCYVNDDTRSNNFCGKDARRATFFVIFNIETETMILVVNAKLSHLTQMLTSKCYIFIQQIYVLNILNMVYTLRFFFSKFSLFHNYNVFGSYIIHIL
jgi:hypothetical protein